MVEKFTIEHEIKQAQITTISQQETAVSLREHVNATLARYFDELGDVPPSNLYNMVLEQMELPLLEMVMSRFNNNQSLAAKVLGISRGTLRKKLKMYGFIVAE